MADYEVARKRLLPDGRLDIDSLRRMADVAKQASAER